MKVLSDLDMAGNDIVNRGNDPGGGGASIKSGVAPAITEGTSRSVTFATAFASVPNVVIGFADSLSEISVCAAHSPTVTGFTIQVEKSGGGAAKNRDVAWIATDAGSP